MKKIIMIPIVLLSVISLPIFAEKYAGESARLNTVELVIQKKVNTPRIIEYYEEENLIVEDNIAFDIGYYSSTKGGEEYCFEKKGSDTICFRKIK